MQFKVDWLTLSLIPSSMVEDTFAFYKSILHLLCLDDFQSDFEEFGGGKYYKNIYRYKNISIKVPDTIVSDRTGFGIEFTGQGIDFYIDYMRSKYPDYDVRNLLSSFFSLAEDESLRCTVPRIDIASDDISYKNKKNYPLDLSRIRDALVNLEFSSPFAIKSQTEKFEVSFVGSQRAILKSFRGTTIYLGNRRSNVFCRFYDKLAEMEVHKKEFDEKIKHWVRMEFVFRNDRAKCIAENLVSLSDEEFAKFYAEIVNHYITFVDVTENNRSNVCRCKPKKWWSDYLGVVRKSKLVNTKPTENHYVRFKKYMLSKISAGMAAIFECEPVDKVMLEIKEASEASKTKTHDKIVNDYIALKNGYDKSVPLKKGLEEYSYYIEDYKKFLIELRKKREYNNFFANPQKVN